MVTELPLSALHILMEVSSLRSRRAVLRAGVRLGGLQLHSLVRLTLALSKSLWTGVGGRGGQVLGR